jgi:hypothetical protein
MKIGTTKLTQSCKDDYFLCTTTELLGLKNNNVCVREESELNILIHRDFSYKDGKKKMRQPPY